jgi:hypothetical protein
VCTWVSGTLHNSHMYDYDKSFSLSSFSLLVTQQSAHSNFFVLDQTKSQIRLSDYYREFWPKDYTVRQRTLFKRINEFEVNIQPTSRSLLCIYLNFPSKKAEKSRKVLTAEYK